MTAVFINKHIVERFDFSLEESATFLKYFKDQELTLLDNQYQNSRFDFSISWAKKIRAIYTIESIRPSIILKKLHKHGSVQRYFEFLGNTYKHWVDMGLFGKLPIPDFYTKGQTFIEIYNTNFKRHMSFKCYCEIVNEYGIKGLNNIFRYKEIYETLTTDICKNLRLDEDIHITKDHFYRSMSKKTQELLLRNYGPRRLYRVLATLKDLDDIDALFGLLDHYVMDAKKVEELEKTLPRKPKNFKDIVKVVGVKNFTNFKSHYYKMDTFEQEIQVYNGQYINGFQVVVPTSYSELCEISFYLRNCVKTYVDKIIKGTSQIFALKREQKFYACVELQLEDDNWQVVQAKGHSNDLFNDVERKNINQIASQILKF